MLDWIFKHFNRLKGTRDLATVPWLTWALSKVGTHKISDIESWFNFCPDLPPHLWRTITPWCSVFVNAAFGFTGFKGTRGHNPISWRYWGTEVEYIDALPGDVVTFESDSGKHYVGLMLSQDDDNIQIVGGSQERAGVVIKEWVSKDFVINVRRA